MCTNGTAVSPQRSLRKQHRSEHHLNSNGSTPMASEHHLNRHTSMNQNVSSITSSSQLTIPAYQSVAPGGATAGSAGSVGSVGSSAGSTAGGAALYDTAMNDVQAQIKILSSKSSTLRAGRARVKQLREHVRLQQLELVKEQRLLELSLQEVNGLEKQIARDVYGSASDFLPVPTEGNEGENNRDDTLKKEKESRTTLNSVASTNAIISQLNQQGQILYADLIDSTRKVTIMGRRNSLSVLGQITRQNQEDRAEEALKAVHRDEHDYVMYSEFVTLLVEYSQRDSDLVDSLELERKSKTSPTYEAKSRSASQFKRGLDDVVGHHQILVGRCFL